MRRFIFYTIILLFVFLPVLLFGQSNFSSLKGIVIDAYNEEPLSGATVYILQTEDGTFTDVNGEFIVKDIKSGAYKLRISYIGYHTKEQVVNIDADRQSKVIIYLEPEVKPLDEVTITAKSQARELREQAMPISVISMNQLQGTVSNVRDVLAKTVGVTIRSSGGVGSSSRISVRGLEGKRIGFFIDGLPMNDNTDFVDINDIPVEMIDRIEIYKGVVPAKFGGSAVGGAVNIVIREYPPKYLDVNYTIESFNTHKVSLVAKRNLAEKGYEFGAGGFYTYSDNNYVMQSPFDDSLIIKRDHDRFRKYVVATSFKARKWWFDLVEFEIPFINTFKEIQGIEHNIQHAYTKSNAVVFANKMEKKNFFLEGLDFENNLAYAYTQYSFIDTAAHRVYWDGTPYPAVSALGGEIGKWASDSYNQKHTLMDKLNLNYVINNNHSINFNSIFNMAFGIPKDDVKEKVLGYRIDFNSKMMSLIAGLSYDYRTNNDVFLNSFSVKYYFYNMNTSMASIISPEKKDINLTKSNIGINDALRVRIIDNLMFKTALGYDVRLPSETELLGDGFIIAPAADLEPERNSSINIGLLYDLTGKHPSNLQIEVSSFYMYLKNMIRFTGGVLQSQYQNFGEMRTIGVELEVKSDITSWLYGYVSGTYQDLRDMRKFEKNTTVPNPTKGSRMPNIPYLMANAGLEFHKENLFGGKEQNTRVFLDGAFIEEYLYDFEQSIYQQRRIPRSLSLDLGIEHSFKNGRFIISGMVRNFTNARIISEFNRPLPGRNFGLRLRYVFK